MKTEPFYYPDAGALSFNVKTLGTHWPEGGTDAQRQEAWEVAQQCWWHDAKLLAIKHGFTDVECHGRSDGWLTPVPGVMPAEQNANFAADLARIRAFGADLSALFNEAPRYFESVLTDVLVRDVDAQEAVTARDQAIAKLIELATHTAERPGAMITLHMAKLASDALEVLQPCATS